MDNLLHSYLSKRVGMIQYPKKKAKPPGPVITVSREVGCSGLELAFMLAKQLNLLMKEEKWNVLSKEIFSESARELNLHPEQVAKIFKQPERSSFDEILNAFSEKRYKTDKKIKKTVVDVIRSFAEDGFCIIVGRGSNIVAADIRNSLHIRLVAPLEDRINSIMTKNNWSRADSVLFIKKVEKERIAYRHAVLAKSSDDPEIFDMTFNRTIFPPEIITELVLLAAEKKGIFADYFRIPKS